MGAAALRPVFGQCLLSVWLVEWGGHSRDRQDSDGMRHPGPCTYPGLGWGVRSPSWNSTV